MVENRGQLGCVCDENLGAVKLFILLVGSPRQSVGPSIGLPTHSTWTYTNNNNILVITADGRYINKSRT